MHPLDFLLVDRSAVFGQAWQLDDESGAPYTPMRFTPSIAQVHEWQAEMTAAIVALATLQRWPSDVRRATLANVLLEPGLTMQYSLRTVRELVRSSALANRNGD